MAFSGRAVARPDCLAKRIARVCPPASAGRNTTSPPGSRANVTAAPAPQAEKVELIAADGHRLSAWSARPVGTPKGGIVVLHAVYGATRHMGDVCARWAAAGYRAIAPALFDRLGRDIVHPYDRPDDGIKSYDALADAQAHADIQAAVAAAGPIGRVAISGFCTGGSWAWRASARFRFPAQVNFYGSHIPALIELVPQCPTILHYGEKDRLAPMSAIDAIRTRHPAVELYVYPGAAHAFENAEQASFDATAADLAWQRSIAFMDRHVAS
jgi:carboxymethylenebutenolidase